MKNLGKAVSHGCVRLSPENAAALYNSVEAKGMANTQVVVQEGDAGVAQGAKPRKRTPPTYPADDYAEQPACLLWLRRQPWWTPDYAARRIQSAAVLTFTYRPRAAVFGSSAARRSESAIRLGGGAH